MPIEPAVNLARAAILIALFFTAVIAAILLLCEPPRACPGWHPLTDSSETIWLMLLFWTAPSIALPCFIVVRWNWLLQKATERNGSGLVPADEAGDSVLVPAEFALSRICVVSAAVSQFPLLFVVDCVTR